MTIARPYVKPTIVDLITAIQVRTARVAVSASATRNQGGPGLVAAARSFLGGIDLQQFGVNNASTFLARLDEATAELRSALPQQTQNWGVARKLLNIFLRDALYTHYLRLHSGLAAAEPFLELPLDSITVGRLRSETPPRTLPRWRGVKNLQDEASALYQAAAAGVAETHGISRIHLDAVWWGLRKDE